MPEARTIEDLSAPSWTDFLTQRRPARRLVQPLVEAAVKSLASLPERATRAAGELQRTGDVYDPAPAVETAMLGPMASFPMALGGKMDPNLLAALYLKRFEPTAPFKGDPMMHRFGLLDQTGKDVGHLRTSVYKYPDIYVENIRTNQRSPLALDALARQANMASQAIGPRDIRSLMMGLRNEYPTAESVSGYRVSGARAAPGSDAVERLFNAQEGSNARMRLPQFTPEQMQAYLADAPPVVRGQGPRPSAPEGPETRAHLDRIRAERLGEQSPDYWTLESMQARAAARDRTTPEAETLRALAQQIRSPRPAPSSDAATEAALRRIQEALQRGGNW